MDTYKTAKTLNVKTWNYNPMWRKSVAGSVQDSIVRSILSIKNFFNFYGTCGFLQLLLGAMDFVQYLLLGFLERKRRKKSSSPIKHSKVCNPLCEYDNVGDNYCPMHVENGDLPLRQNDACVFANGVWLLLTATWLFSCIRDVLSFLWFLKRRFRGAWKPENVASYQLVNETISLTTMFIFVNF